MILHGCVLCVEIPSEMRGDAPVPFLVVIVAAAAAGPIMHPLQLRDFVLRMMRTRRSGFQYILLTRKEMSILISLKQSCVTF